MQRGNFIMCGVQAQSFYWAGFAIDFLTATSSMNLSATFKLKNV
jgi:hypothetical protein